MNDKNFYNWDVKTGDYLRDEEYDKLYLKHRKHEKLVRNATLFGAVLAVASLFFIVMETLTSH